MVRILERRLRRATLTSSDETGYFELDFAEGFWQVFPIVRLVESRATTSFQKKAAQGLTCIRETLPEGYFLFC